ncbi:MAG: cytochrome P450, partial [Actinomycetota bacterium]|nr:cytochrome P450 [Actinomycetota bacterium]
MDVDHHSREFLADRHEQWRQLRKTPVAYDTRYGGFWVVSGYAEVAQVARDAEIFSSELGQRDGVELRGIAGVPRTRGIPPAGIAEAERSTHQALRRAINPFFLPPAVKALRPSMVDLATWFIDQKIRTGRMDLVADLTNPVPAVITMQLIGLPCDHWDYYADLFHATVASRPGAQEYDRAIARIPEMMAELLEEARSRRAQPGDDLLSQLVELRRPSGDPLSDQELTAVLWNLVGGGLDTTTSLTSLT